MSTLHLFLLQCRRSYSNWLGHASQRHYISLAPLLGTPLGTPLPPLLLWQGRAQHQDAADHEQLLSLGLLQTLPRGGAANNTTSTSHGPPSCTPTPYGLASCALAHRPLVLGHGTSCHCLLQTLHYGGVYRLGLCAQWCACPTTIGGGGLGHHPVRSLAGAPLVPELLMYMGYQLFSGFGWGFTVNQHFLHSRMGTMMPMYACCGFCATLVVWLSSCLSGCYQGGILPSSLQQNGVGMGINSRRVVLCTDPFGIAKPAVLP